MSVTLHLERAGRTFYRARRGHVAAGVRQYLEFGDHLGSTSFVADHDSGLIVERAGYLGYGGPDEEYRPSYPALPQTFREPYRYTGHDDDSEVGLSYAGARYYIPMLARWASPDPGTIHGIAGQLNPYVYAADSPMRYVDPLGLAAEQASGGDDSGLAGELAAGLWLLGQASNALDSAGGAPAGYFPGLRFESVPISPNPGFNENAASSGGFAAAAVAAFAPPGSAFGSNTTGRNALAIALGAAAAVGLVALAAGNLAAPEVAGWFDSAAPTLMAWAIQGANVVYAMTAAETGVVATGGGAAVTAAAVAASDALEAVESSPAARQLAAEALPELEIRAAKYPDLAENIRNALGAGRSDVLTHGGDVAANRAAALRDVPNIPGLSRDEFPFASSMEGGEGAWVGHIPAAQQSAQGGLISNFLRANGIGPGMQYRVVVTP